MKLNVRTIEVEQATQGLTVSELAEKAGMSRQNLSTIIRRGTAMPVTIGKLARALGLDPAEIMKEE